MIGFRIYWACLLLDRLVPLTKTDCSTLTFNFQMDILLSHQRCFIIPIVRQGWTQTCTRKVKFVSVYWEPGPGKEVKLGQLNQHYINYSFQYKVNRFSDVCRVYRKATNWGDILFQRLKYIISKVSNQFNQGHKRFIKGNEVMWCWRSCFFGEIFAFVFRCNSVGNYMFKVNKRNTRTSCKISSKLAIKTMASFWCLYC